MVNTLNTAVFLSISMVLYMRTQATPPDTGTDSSENQIPTCEQIKADFPSRSVRCDKTGFYRPMQCRKSFCNCADQRTGVSVGNYNFKKDHELFRGACKCHRKYTNSLSPFEVRNRCNDVGGFLPRQCNEYWCHCVDHSGRKTGKKFRSNKKDTTSTNNDCQCEYDNADRESSGSTFQCDANGRYVRQQCNGETCHCVNNLGKKIGTFQFKRFDVYPSSCKCAEDHQTDATLLNETCDERGEYPRAKCTETECECIKENGENAGYSTKINMDDTCLCARGLYTRVSTFSMCDTYGGYLPLRCENGAPPSRCQCIGKFGEKIGKSFIWRGSTAAAQGACQCEHDKAYSILKGAPINATCDEYGRYRLQQCDGNRCYCSDRKGNKIPNSEFSAENPNIPGACRCKVYQNNFSKCDKYGRYKWRHCQGSLCFCLDYNGKSIIGMRKGFQSTSSDDCRCEQEKAYLIENESRRTVNCDDKGGYLPIQCTKLKCYCVNRNGKRKNCISSVNVDQKSELNCAQKC